jgi:dihydrofolate reductase
MSKLVNSTYITLDGAVENPHTWPSGRHEDDGRAQEVQTKLLQGSDAVLMGRRTYDGFAMLWPTKSGDPYSDKINAMEKLVASTTLNDPEWNNTTVIDDDLVGEIARRKEAGGDIVQYGFGEVSRTLLDAGLIDELRLWVPRCWSAAAQPTTCSSATAPPPNWSSPTSTGWPPGS